MKNKKIYNYIAKVAIFSALSFILYMFPKFPLPIFPPFLDVQFSNLPAILGGFILGPLGGSIIVLVRFIIKLPFSGTAYVGEFADLLLGLAVVLSSSSIYKFHRTKKGGLIALLVAVLVWTVSAVAVNYFINIPFFIKAFFGGDITGLVQMCSSAIKGITAENFMQYYLLYAVVPFNLMLSVFVCLVTFLVYKKISDIFKKDFFDHHKKNKEKETENE